MSTQYGGLPKWNNINFSKNFMNFLACGCLTADVLCFTVCNHGYLARAGSGSRQNANMVKEFPYPAG